MLYKLFKTRNRIERMKKCTWVLPALLLLMGGVRSQTVEKEFTTSALKAMGAPNNPQVEVAWNRYYDWQEIGDICRRIAAAYPDLARFGSIGTSVQGKAIPLLTITNFKQGNPDRKPGMYIDGNIHSNEIQGGEVALYTAWYLTENYGRVDWLTDLVDHKVFYIVPTINPDARDHFIHQANNQHSPRTGLLPRDDDGDGLVDEDGYDDLDGDGNIVQMRKRDPNGRWVTDPEDPRLMIRAKPDQPGEYTLLGWEGFDNDGDGRVNEDGPGFYDPNRNWGWGWQPAYTQYGADQYPFSIPEDRAVADFVMAHPNIAGAQTYHNSGGMILRGPGTEEDIGTYNRRDVDVYDFLGELGEQMLPGYRYLVLYKDLYPAVGGELDWFYGAEGIFTFSNELWTAFNYYRGKETPEGQKASRQENLYRFDRLLLFKEGIVPWKRVNHPQYGEIEIGGVKKSWTRTPPSFMLEDLCHRNMAFTLFHAYYLPRLSVDSVRVQDLPGGLQQIDVIVKNSRVVPSRSYHEVRKDITPPDYIALAGKNGEVVAGFLVDNPYLNIAREQEHHPERLAVETIPGMGTVQVRWIVAGRGPYQVTVDSRKGGLVTTAIPE